MPQLMEVLEFFDNSGSILAKRIPEDDECEIKWGAQLTVRESQNVVFFRDGKSLDVFGPGRYILKTMNIPIITKWVTQFGYGPRSPFRSEVYFLNMKLFHNLKWGTVEPIPFEDDKLKLIRLGAHGIFSFQIKDSSLFLNKIVGTQGIYQDSDIKEYLKNLITNKFIDTLGKNFKTLFEVPKNFTKLSELTKNEIHTDFLSLGLSLHNFAIKSLHIPPEVQRNLDERAGKEAVGNLNEYLKKKFADALGPAANNPGGTASTGLGAGIGLGMGLKLFELLKDGHNNTSPDNVQSSLNDPIKRLKILKELKEQNIITEQEFQETKKRILENL